MKPIVVIATVLAVFAVAVAAFAATRYKAIPPKPTTEVVMLDAAKRTNLQRLRAERKFQPEDYPPLGYTGMVTPEDETTANAALDGVIDAILAHRDGPIAGNVLANLFGKAMSQVDFLETEDRDRTQGYLLEIWYIMGFKGPTGLFTYGSAFPHPEGYGEPLPPGWTSPDRLMPPT